MSSLSVNDNFPSRKEAEEAMVSYAVNNNFNYSLEETPKSISVLCKGREEFGCEAKIVAMLRKKDDVFVVKKIKLSHKCPSLTLQYGSTNEMVKAEIRKAIGNAALRIGEVIPILANLNIKVGYFSVWKAMRSGVDELKENTNVAEDNEVKRRKIPDGENLLGAALDEFTQEFLDLNPDLVAHHRDQMFFFSFPDHLKVLLPIVEIRVYKRTGGFVVFGVLHGPTSSPIVYSCAIGESDSRSSVLAYFIESTLDVFFLVDFDTEIINLLKEANREFFVKTRDICKFYYNKTRSTDVVEGVWNKCNNDSQYDTPELDALEPKRYIKKYCEVEMLGLHNTSECDVEFINLGVFSFTFFDCVNGVLRLISDNLKQRKKVDVDDKKSMFGYKVMHRIEKNLSITLKDNTYEVDLENQTCTCGKFQELLIPCPHACKVIVDAGEDPYLYVSQLYSRKKLLELKELVPVVNLPVKCQSDRHLLRRGPGRPKKIFLREQATGY